MPKKSNRPPNNWVLLSNLALQMGAIIAAGAFLGVWLDGKFPNTYSLYTVIGSLLGVFIALYSVFRQLKNLNEEKDNDQ